MSKRTFLVSVPVAHFPQPHYDIHQFYLCSSSSLGVNPNHGEYCSTVGMPEVTYIFLSTIITGMTGGGEKNVF